MGSYYGIASRLRVRKDAPQQLVNMLDWLYELEGSENYQLATGEGHTKKVEEMMTNLHDNLVGNSGYMDTWNWRVKEEKDSHWLYESRSSRRFACYDEFISLLHGIQEFLLMEEGEIFFRYIYEEAAREKVVFFKEGKFEKGDGYEYTHDRGYVTDWEHPYRDELSKEEVAKYASGELKRTERPKDHHQLFWTMGEIKHDVEVKQRRRDRELKVARGRGNIGFGPY